MDTLLLGTAAFFTVTLFLGMSLWSLARWARYKGAEFAADSPAALRAKKHAAFERDYGEFLRIVTFSRVARPLEWAGRALAALAILGVGSLLSWMAFRLFTR